RRWPRWFPCLTLALTTKTHARLYVMASSQQKAISRLRKSLRTKTPKTPSKSLFLARLLIRFLEGLRWDVRLDMRFEPTHNNKYEQGRQCANNRGDFAPHPGGDPGGRSNPNAGSGSQPFDHATVVLFKNGAGTQKANTCNDALQDAASIGDLHATT